MNGTIKAKAAAKLWKLLRFLITAVFLYGVWIVFTVDFSLFAMLAGAVGALGISAFTYQVFLADHDASLSLFVPRPHRLLLFMVGLLIALYRSSFQMVGMVFSRRIKPRVVFFRTRLASDLGRSALANAITLTPGTITLDLDEDHLTVHWIDAQTTQSRGAGAAIMGNLENLLRKVWH
jgi:multicomponent Na+:H+ antiporter subunit E